MNPDFVDLLRAFADAEVRYLEDFAQPGMVFQIGVPPGRMDVLTELSGITFAEAWPEREPGRFGDLTVDFLGREALIRNKRATGRLKDLADIEDL